MAKYKKRPDGRYEAKVNVGVRPDGTYIRKAVYGHTIAELDENIRQAKNHAEQGVDLVAQKPTVKAWADKWLEAYKPDIGRSMRSVYAGMINKWLAPLHPLRVDKVRQVQLQEILLDASQKLSQSSVDKLYNCIRGVFSSARRNGLMAIDVSETLKKPTGGTKAKRDALTDEEREILIETCAEVENGALPMLMLFAGLRIGEALALTYGDVTGGHIVVSKTVVREENGNKATVKDSPKTAAGFRKIPILPPLEPYLTPPDGVLPSKYIFTSGGRLYSKTMIRRAWHAIIDAYRAKWDERHSGGEVRVVARDITAHMLRHTYITMLYDAGVDVKTAQRWAGHATVSVLMDIYTHLSENKEAEAAEKLKRFVSGKNSDDNFDDTDDRLTTKIVSISAK